MAPGARHRGRPDVHPDRRSRTRSPPTRPSARTPHRVRPHPARARPPGVALHLLHHGAVPRRVDGGTTGVRARHRPARAGQPGRLPARRARRARPWSPTRPTALPWQLHERGRRRRSRRARPRPRGVGRRPPGQNVHDDRLQRRHRRRAPATRSSPTARPATRSTSAPTSTSSCAYDALTFFYPSAAASRSTARPVGAEYARPAGHVGVAPNQGDNDVPCPCADLRRLTCDYTLDVRGGWYDAGDHGKYVVNGGISVGQLLSTYERTLTAPTATPAGARRRHAAHPGAAATGCPTSWTRRAGSWSSC